jgi:tRNA modification GTPase
LEALAAARAALGEGLSPEFVAEELRAALNAAGEILGRTEADDILGRIFSSFCIGK